MVQIKLNPDSFRRSGKSIGVIYIYKDVLPINLLDKS